MSAPWLAKPPSRGGEGAWKEVGMSALSVLRPLLLLAAGAGAVTLATASLSDYLLTLLSIILLNVMLAVSLTLTNGLTGLFSLGHPAFMTIGGYAAAILTFPASRKGFMLPALPEFLAGL